MSDDYQLVPLANGEKTLFSARYGEKMHPGLGPSAEAEVLYVRQLGIRERLPARRGPFVVWDVGLGAAANALALLRATREVPGELHLVSFDNTSEPLEFALKHAAELGYPAGYETELTELLRARSVEFAQGNLKVRWKFILGDFPKLLAAGTLGCAGTDGSSPGGEIPPIDSRIEPRNRAGETPAPLPVHGQGVELSGEGQLVRGGAEPGGKRPPAAPGRMPDATAVPPPDAIFYDAFSPAKNPAMWTLPVFADLFRALDPARPCALTTYTRSTMIRATLLLAGFYVGVGHATGLKEETTMAANAAGLIAEPLDARWLARARRSDSAEPLREAAYARKPLRPGTAETLAGHAQFRRA